MFTTDASERVKHGIFQFIAVRTPPNKNGLADMQYVLAVARAIGENMDDYKVITDNPTVPCWHCGSR